MEIPADPQSTRFSHHPSASCRPHVEEVNNLAISERIDNYAYILVRITAARGRLLRVDQLEDLTKCVSVDDFKLKLASSKQDMSAETINNSKDLEKAFQDVLFDYINLIINNAPHECQEFVMQYIEKYAIENLKALVVGKILSTSESELKERIFFPVERIMRTEKTILEALRHAELEQVLYIYKRTRYGELLKDIVSQYEKTREVFFVYALLDKHYIENLNLMLLYHTHWSHASRDFVKIFVGTLTDFYNLVCAIRGQMNDFTQTEIRIITTPAQFHYRVYYDDFNTLYKQGSDKEKIAEILKNILRRYPCGAKYTDIISPDRIMRSLRQFYYRVLLTQVRKNRFEQGQELGGIIAFLIEKEAELDNLVTIFEGVKNNIDPETIRSFLRLK